ncbi:hypothetical protein R3P38DRAFT_2417242, partial [Favolaschia claudopus]
MKLKSYLELDPSKRAQWCYVADARFSNHTLKAPKVDTESIVNPFLQTWKVKKSVLNAGLKDMLTVAKKFGVKFAAMTPSKELLMELPMWHHFGEDPSKRHVNNSKSCRCLRQNHGAINMEDAVKISARLTSPSHGEKATCNCLACADDRTRRGCTNPHSCAMTARTKLDKLLPRWDPRKATCTEDSDSDSESEEEDENKITFPRPLPTTKVSDGFRIFTNTPTMSANANPAPRRRGLEARVHASFAGSVTRKNSEIKSVGAGVWLSTGSELNISLKLSEESAPTRQSAETIAALAKIQTTHRGTEVELESERGFVAKAMTKHLRRWEDTGWIGVVNPSPLKALASELNQRTGKTTFIISEDSPGPDAALLLSKAGEVKEEIDEVYMKIRPRNALPGAKLSKLTQSLAYKGIKQMRAPISRKATDENILLVQAAILANFRYQPTPSAIWKKARQREILPNIRNFLWKSIHNAHRIGKYWNHIP